MKLQGGNFKGSFKGTLGNYTLYTRKGEQILRMKQTQVENPKTELQLMQRSIFKNATSQLKEIRDGIKKAYGAIDKNNEYSALMRQMLNSLEVKVPFLPKAGNYNVLLKNGDLNFKDEVLAQNYTNEGVNLFDVGETIRMYDRTKMGEPPEITEMYPFEILLNGKYTSDNQKADDVFYFGSDYVLPNLIDIRALNIDSITDTSTGNASYQTVNTFKTTISISNIVETNGIYLGAGKTRGFVSNLSQVGGIWSYVYSIHGSEINKILKNLNFTAIRFNGVDNSTYLNTFTMSYNFIISVPSSANKPAVQILKATCGNSTADLLYTYHSEGGHEG